MGTIKINGFLSFPDKIRLKTVLEGHFGFRVVVALNINDSDYSAKVQFRSSVEIDKIISDINEGICFETCQLSARQIPEKLYIKPYDFDEDNVTLHLGSQVSENNIQFLYKSKNVLVQFSAKRERFYFIVYHDYITYKLELICDSIRKINLYCSEENNKNNVVIQLSAVPRIYEAANYDPATYYRDPPGENWWRTTDFTNGSIGQSFCLCLDFAKEVDLSTLSTYFRSPIKNNVHLNFGRGSNFCKSLDVVPVVEPDGFDVPYEIVYKVSALVQHGIIPGPLVNNVFSKLHERDDTSTLAALDKLYLFEDVLYDPVNSLVDAFEDSGQPIFNDHVSDKNFARIRKVLVTPSKIYFLEPTVDLSNRVLRKYTEHDNFLRVIFVDEEFGYLQSPAMQKPDGRKSKIFDRISNILNKGIQIGDKHFEFLAFSQTQLRENTIWMFAPVGDLNAAAIRAWMGDFNNLKSVGKYAARLGLSLSSSKKGGTVETSEIEKIPDVECVTDGQKYIFSDGIGKISEAFAKEVAENCGYNYTPSAYQIRYAGYKGVVAVHPKTSSSSSKKLFLRNSMLKFESKNTEFDVLDVSKSRPLYLNRQFIILLSSLGVKDDVFEKKLKQDLERLNSMVTDPEKELTRLSHCISTVIMKAMLLCGCKPNVDPFLSRMMQVIQASRLREMSCKTSIYVPNGRNLMGCLDEYRILEYGQVFVQHSKADSDQRTVVKGKVMVARSPCLHPGDVRVLEAIDVPKLYHMVDCVIFPQKGDRPHPNECSGGDLDGDLYYVCWDLDLLPPKQEKPMDYTAATSIPPDGDVTVEDVLTYFTDYVGQDKLGIISHSHLAFADQNPEMANAGPCLELAKLFSVAVDSPKTGAPVEIPEHLRATEFPDFMEKPAYMTRKSKSVLGKLHKMITSKQTTVESTMEEDIFDADMVVQGSELYLEKDFSLKKEYDDMLGSFMDAHGIKTEADLFMGNNMITLKSSTWKTDPAKVLVDVEKLTEKARAWFNKDKESADIQAKASAWYQVTYGSDYTVDNSKRKHGPLFSFAWCVHDSLIELKKSKQNLLA